MRRQTALSNSSIPDSRDNSSSSDLDLSSSDMASSTIAMTRLSGILQDDDADEDEVLRRQPATGMPSFFVMQVTAVASLGGILFGYDLGVISGALPLLTDDFNLDNSQKQLVVSVLYVGGGLGAALGGSLCDVFGRKRAILLTDLVFLLGAFLLAVAPDVATVVLGRVVVGFGVAVSGIADVSYLHEIAPVQWRGAIVSVNEACISLGFLFAFGVGGILASQGRTDGWRTMFGLSGVVAMVQFIGMWNMPESPKWLAERGREEESEEALRRIQSGGGGVELNITPSSRNNSGLPLSPSTQSTYYHTIEPDSLVQSGLPDANPSSTKERLSQSGICGKVSYFATQVVLLFRQFFAFCRQTLQDYRKQSIITLFLAITQQLCGQTNVLSYAPMIFAGDDREAASDYVGGWSTLSIGLVKFVVTVLVIWKIESLGRRYLLLVGMLTIAAGLVLLMLANFLATPVVVALPGVLLVVTGYSMSFGPLTWLITSELFPTEIRGRALGVCTIITYLTAAITTDTFLSSQEWLGGISRVFAVYLAVTLAGVVFAYRAIPDTGTKSVEDIDRDLNVMPWWLERAAEPVSQEERD